MKQKIAILTDSTSSIYTAKHSYDNVFMINSPAYIQDQVFTDFDLYGDTPFYEAVAQSTAIPKTSQPSIGETVEQYKKIRDLGYTHIICLPISKELSGTYQNAHLAKDLVQGIEVEVVDTLTTVSVLCGMALEAARLAKAGHTVEEIVEKITELRKKSGFYAAIKDLTSLIKNGRLSNAKGFVANLLNIKPIIHLDEFGKIVGIKNVRTYQNAMKQVVDYVLEGVDVEHGVIHISYTTNTEDLEYVRQLILEKVPNAKIEVYTLAATIVAHTGLSAIAVGYINYK